MPNLDSAIAVLDLLKVSRGGEAKSVPDMVEKLVKAKVPSKSLTRIYGSFMDDETEKEEICTPAGCVRAYIQRDWKFLIRVLWELEKRGY